MRTWHYEIFVMAVILSATTFFFANNDVNWVTTLAILLTFNHAQIGDRLQERQGAMDKPTVECYHKLNKLFAGKELVWIMAFMMMRNYAAIVGSALFFAYPLWRKFYRKHIKPLQSDFERIDIKQFDLKNEKKISTLQSFIELHPTYLRYVAEYSSSIPKNTEDLTLGWKEHYKNFDIRLKRENFVSAEKCWNEEDNYWQLEMEINGYPYTLKVYFQEEDPDMEILYNKLFNFVFKK